MDAEAMLIVEVEGSERRDRGSDRPVRRECEPIDPMTLRVSQSEEEAAAIWKGRKSAFGAFGRISDYTAWMA